jgi:hypothetical protein
MWRAWQCCCGVTGGCSSRFHARIRNTRRQVCWLKSARRGVSFTRALSAANDQPRDGVYIRRNQARLSGV